MFTGLIQAVGHLQSRETLGGDLRLCIATGTMATGDLQLGESIAVSGVCLTVVAFDPHSFAADVSNETLTRTTLGELRDGAAVNLERSLLPTTRLGGHLVSGHVDGLGRVGDIRDDGRSQRWFFSAQKKLLRYVAEKGSIAVDGVSLTVNGVDEYGFEVNLVPHTVANTAFASAVAGASVNIEVDLVARYVERLANTKDWA
jgi:riboflavin synthase